MCITRFGSQREILDGFLNNSFSFKKTLIARETPPHSWQMPSKNSIFWEPSPNAFMFSINRLNSQVGQIDQSGQDDLPYF